jgi:hypothetical protein
VTEGAIPVPLGGFRIRIRLPRSADRASTGTARQSNATLGVAALRTPDGDVGRPQGRSQFSSSDVTGRRLLTEEQFQRSLYGSFAFGVVGLTDIGGDDHAEVLGSVQ